MTDLQLLIIVAWLAIIAFYVAAVADRLKDIHATMKITLTRDPSDSQDRARKGTV